MYVPMVIALMFLFPLIAIVAQMMLTDHGVLTAAVSMGIVAKWYVFSAVGVRLSLAGLRQMFQPRFTAQAILGINSPDALFLVRELGIANVAMGTAGLGTAAGAGAGVGAGNCWAAAGPASSPAAIRRANVNCTGDHASRNSIASRSEAELTDPGRGPQLRWQPAREFRVRRLQSACDATYSPIVAPAMRTIHMSQRAKSWITGIVWPPAAIAPGRAG